MARMGEGRTAEGNRLLRRPKSRCEDYIKVNVKEMGRGGGSVDLIHLVEDKKICWLF